MLDRLATILCVTFWSPTAANLLMFNAEMFVQNFSLALTIQQVSLVLFNNQSSIQLVSDLIYVSSVVDK